MGGLVCEFGVGGKVDWGGEGGEVGRWEGGKGGR